MEALKTLLNALFLFIQLWVASYLLITIFWVICDILNIRKKAKLQNPNQSPAKEYHFAAIVTLHQNTIFAEPIIDSLIRQTYKNITIYVVADDCAKINLPFSDERVHILYPETPFHSKIKSIQYALKQAGDKYDALTIFDPDNLIHPDFFNKVNRLFQEGYRVVQGNLQPKNLDTDFARMDALSDVYHNFIDRIIPARLGLSSHIWGLGITIEKELYQSIVYQHFLGGFDKKMQAEMVKKTRIAYAEDAIVYDEKIKDGEALQKQRTRWINAFFRYWKNAFQVFMQGVKSFNFDLAFFGYNLMRPPLFLLVLASVFLTAVNIFISSTSFVIWLGVLAAFFISFIYILQTGSMSTQKQKTILTLPMFFVRQVKALLGIKKANKNFLKTENNKVIFINELVQV